MSEDPERAEDKFTEPGGLPGGLKDPLRVVSLGEVSSPMRVDFSRTRSTQDWNCPNAASSSGVRPNLRGHQRARTKACIAAKKNFLSNLSRTSVYAPRLSRCLTTSVRPCAQARWSPVLLSKLHVFTTSTLSSPEPVDLGFSSSPQRRITTSRSPSKHAKSSSLTLARRSLRVELEVRVAAIFEVC